jgi:hypothetical protein
MLIPYDFTPPMRGPSELLKSQRPEHSASEEYAGI